MGTNSIGWCGCNGGTPKKSKWCLDVLTYIEQRYCSSNLDKPLVTLTMTCFWRFQFTSNSISLQQALDTQDSSCPDLTLLAATFHHDNYFDTGNVSFKNWLQPGRWTSSSFSGPWRISHHFTVCVSKVWWNSRALDSECGQWSLDLGACLACASTCGMLLQVALDLEESMTTVAAGLLFFDP